MREAALVAGLGCWAAGLMMAAGYVAAAATGPPGLQLATMFGSLALTATILGAGLVGAGLRQGGLWPRRTFGARGPGRWLIALVALVFMGQMALHLPGAVSLVVFPPLHFLTAVAVTLAVMSTVVWHAGGRPVSQIWTGLAYGGCLATSLALVLESIAAVVLVVALLGLIGPQEATALMHALQAALDSAPGTSPPAVPPEVIEQLLRPAVIAAVAGLFGVVGPLIEELVKLFGVTLRRPASRYDAWFWGTAAGAGFGLTESIAHGSMLLAEWPLTVGVRAAALLMHAAVAGMAGIGWYMLVRERRRVPGLATIAAAIGGHMLWNQFVLTSVLAGLAAASGGHPALGLIAAGSAAALVALFATLFLAFRALSRRLGAQVAPVPPSTPYAAGVTDDIDTPPGL